MERPTDKLHNWINEQIKRKAYFKWEEAGRPQKQDNIFWKKAESEFWQNNPLPQHIGETMGMGYGNDNPNLSYDIERYKSHVLVKEYGYRRDNETTNEYYERIKIPVEQRPKA